MRAAAKRCAVLEEERAKHRLQLQKAQQESTSAEGALRLAVRCYLCWAACRRCPCLRVGRCCRENVPGVVQARNPSPTQGIEAAQLGKEVAHAEDALKKERASLLMVCWPRAEHWLAVLPAVLTRAPDLKVAAGPLTSASAPSQAQARCAAVQEQANSAKQELAATEERLAGARQGSCRPPMLGWRARAGGLLILGA